MNMYLYQDYLRLGEALRNEMEMRKRKDKQNEEMNLRTTDKKSAEKCLKLDVKTGITVDGAYLPKSLSVLNSIKTFQSDTCQISDSFNPLCSICNSNLCTSAFNPKFKACFQHEKP